MAPTTYTTDLKGLDEFSARELYDLMRMRVDVFVVEQNCPYPELDGKDIDALHLRLLDGGELLASARVLKPHSAQDPSKIGRVVVSPAHRGKRLGGFFRQTPLRCRRRPICAASTNPSALSAPLRNI
jgi:ElaA protein